MSRARLSIVVILLAASSAAADTSSLIRTIKAVGPEGAGNVEAASAWRELSRLPAGDLPQLLAALDDASPAASNWLRSAVDTIAERERSAGRPLPRDTLEAFLRDMRHAGRARRLAYELICTADPTARTRLLPTMLDDPAAELRFDAVATAFDATKKSAVESADAKAELRKLLSAARDGAQVEAIAKELERRGERVDLVAHFGFITGWHIAGPFDNADGRGHRTAFPPEAGVDLSAKYVGEGGVAVDWRRHVSEDKAGIIDLNRIFPYATGARTRQGKPKGLKAAVAYACCQVESSTDRQIEVRAASSTAIRVWLNGREVLARETYHQSFDRDAFIGPGRLTKGKNTILVKVCQNDQPEEWAQNWMFQLRLTDNLGAAVLLSVVTPATDGGGRR